MIDIIIPLYNGLEYTKACIASIEKNAQKSSYRIIVVDNASIDGTFEWAEKESTKSVYFNCLHTQTNLGFAGGINIGLKFVMSFASEATHICILNNDTYIPKGFFESMLSRFTSPDIGVVGPVSNRAGGLQCWAKGYGAKLSEQDEGLTPEFFALVEEYSAQHKASYANQVTEAPYLVGLCFLMTKEFFLANGFLDERYFPGMWEEVDYFLQGKIRGFRYLVDKSAFIWHFGSKTFEGKKDDTGDIFKTNRKKYLDKWHSALTLISHELIRIHKEMNHPDPFNPIQKSIDYAKEKK